MIPDQWYEDHRAELQRIHDRPVTDCERAFREIVLHGKSEPKEWEPTLCGMHGLMWHVFQQGWLAHSLRPQCTRPEGCVCGGDAPGVQATCPNWHKANYPAALRT